MAEVGIRELRDHLSKYLEQVQGLGGSEMKARGNRTWDFVPAGVSAAAFAIAVGYVRLLDSQGDSPRLWFLGGMILAAALAAYAAFRSVPRRAEAIAVSGLVLFAFGILGLFSIGFPILVAGVVAIAFAAKTREVRSRESERSIKRRVDQDPA